jgi:hypothetical protein
MPATVTSINDRDRDRYQRLEQMAKDQPTRPGFLSQRFGALFYLDECGREMVCRDHSDDRRQHFKVDFIYDEETAPGAIKVVKDHRSYAERVADEDWLGLVMVGKHREAAKVSAWTTRTADKIRARKIDWLWEGFLANGEIASWVGEPGTGKSLTAVGLGAILSIGAAWPDGSANTNAPCATLYISYEESMDTAVVPRWIAAGGDRKMLHELDTGDDDRLFLDENLEKLTGVIDASMETTSPIKLVVFDPIADYTRKDALKDQEVREVLTKVKAWATDLGICVIALVHTNKKSDLAAIQRASGAKGWVAVPRVNNVVGCNADGQQYIATLKTNGHKPVSMAFKFEDAKIEEDGETISTVKAAWIIGAPSVTAEDLLSPKKQEVREDRRQEVSLKYRAMQWLQNNLTPAGMPAKEAADLYGLSDDQAKRVAKDARVDYVRKGMPAVTLWCYSAPVADEICDADMPF